LSIFMQVLTVIMFRKFLQAIITAAGNRLPNWDLL
jgi:hypothetical protein